jgi:hypothetical protein
MPEMTLPGPPYAKTVSGIVNDGRIIHRATIAENNFIALIAVSEWKNRLMSKAKMQRPLWSVRDGSPSSR